MKRHYAVLALLVMATAVSGCIGLRARDKTLLPAVQPEWEGVRVDAVDGGIAANTLAQFDDAVTSGDVKALTLLWPTVKTAAETGVQARVDAGSVSTGVAASLLERVNNMDEAILTLKKRPPG